MPDKIKVDDKVKVLVNTVQAVQEYRETDLEGKKISKSKDMLPLRKVILRKSHVVSIEPCGLEGFSYLYLVDKRRKILKNIDALMFAPKTKEAE